jgi:hypothetical protein
MTPRVAWAGMLQWVAPTRNQRLVTVWSSSPRIEHLTSLHASITEGRQHGLAGVAGPARYRDAAGLCLPFGDRRDVVDAAHGDPRIKSVVWAELTFERPCENVGERP